MLRLALLLIAALAGTGCIETHLYSGLPPGDPPRGYENRWHVSYLFGTTEGSVPYDLHRLCPSGWSEITVTPDFFTSIAGLMTLYLYTPNRVTIVCARRIALAQPPAAATPSSGPPSPGPPTPNDDRKAP
jgi:hypothetical protein